GLLLMAAPRLSFAGLAILLGLSWITSGLSTIYAAVRQGAAGDWYWQLVDGVVNLALGIAIAVQWPISGIVSVSLLVGFRYLWAGWSTLTGAPPSVFAEPGDAADLHPNEHLGLPPHAYVGQMRRELTAEEAVRSHSDRGWVWLFLFMFFAIHAAR